MTVDRPLRVGVIGAATAPAEDREFAEALGAALAEAGAVVVCGGHGGIMRAVSRGAALAGGTTVGILPGRVPSEANPWITVPIPTGMSEARNAVIVLTAESIVAVGGKWGTLSEIAFAKKVGLEVGGHGVPPAQGLDLVVLEDAAEAARWALEAAERRRNG